MKKSVLFITFLMVTLLAIWQIRSRPLLAEPAAPAEPPAWNGSERELSTINDNRTGIPDIAARDNGTEVTVVFPFEETENDGKSRDPYYVTYNPSTGNWSSPAQVFNSNFGAGTGGESAQLDVLYVGNTAYALWVERIDWPSPPPPPYVTERLYLAAEPWPNASPEVANFIFNTALAGMIDPTMVETGGNIHVFWSTFAGNFVNQIQHRYYDVSADTWSSTVTISTGTSDSRLADVVTDQYGVLHLVWEQDDVSQLPLSQNVYYSRGTLNGSTMNWSTPINIDGGTTYARVPQVAVRNNRVLVAFSEYDADDNGDPQTSQRVLFRSCSNNCTVPGGWSGVQNVSGAFVNIDPGAGAETENVFSEIVFDPGSYTSYLFFHGSTGSSPSEISTTNDCDAWDESRTEVPSNQDTKPVYFPSAAAANGKLYLVYHKEFNEPTNNYQVWGITADLKCTRPSFLPFMEK